MHELDASRAPTVSRTQRRALEELAPSRWIAALVFDWALIVAIFVAVGVIDHPIAYVLAIFPLGSRQQGLGALFHDAAHRLVTRRRWLNDALGGPLAAWPLGLTLAGYRRYHLAHHRTLGTERDPESGHKRLLAHWGLPLRPVHALHFVSDLVGAGLPHLAAAGRMTRPARMGEAIAFVLFWLAIGTFFFWLHAPWIPLLWVASIATVFWSGVRLRIYTEHLGTRDTHRLVMHPIFEAIVMPHAIGLHWEHHHFPRVPFYRLRALRQLLSSPPPVPLGELVRAMRRVPRLPSGEVGDAVAQHLAPVDAGPRRDI